MKKSYSLIAVIAFTAFLSAQGSESFTNLSATSSSYTSGSYTGDNGVTWAFSGARKVTSTDNVTATSIGFSDSGTRTLSANSGANGVGTLTYTVRSYFTSGTASNRTIGVYVNGINVDTYTLALMNTNYTRTVNVNVSGDVLIEFRSTGSKQIVLDDVLWTQYSGSLAVNNLTKTKGSVLKNTFVNNEEITFGAQANDVKIFNMYGQVVKTASAKENESLNIAELQKGNYIVTATVNNKPVSQKILKD
ncbi:Por secretion system C-terminal sorting domain-containing protein [Chryseobacterium taichungense]|uniref:Por secretion system C-terminal sorting domain-containing protein n=1 Tax=Chryseobacterium taichungense TaxID=295069 RepID=A0A1H7W279_9FLAO|nr:T9SS type A sorting domain-containing protein [Chryseobacterium taichungense]SEM15630.1 Por secretion system C-terminal sorting domain-containing protein [Chryseobacterium taichungense]